MKRRVYLATAAVALGGCSSLSDSETAEEDPDDDNETDTGTDDGNETDTGTDDDDGGDDEPVDEESGTFDDFEDLSNWTVMAGSLTADEDRVYTGSQSGRLEASESDERAMIKREFDSPRDLSGEWPALALATDTDVSAIVQLSDDDENRYILRSSVASDAPFAHHDLGVHDTVGDPDLSEIVHIKISIITGEDRSMSLWCDDLHFVSRPDTGKVMLQFDDGYETTATHAYPLLEEYGYPATTFVNTDYVGGENRLDLDHLESLSDAGWTVASQGATGGDLTQGDAGEQEAEFESATEWFADNGFEDGSDYFAYPLGRYDETTLDLAEEHHELAFAGGFPVHGDIANPHLVPRAVHPGADEAEQILDWTAEMNGIATLTYREFDRESYAAFEETMAHLAELESAGEIDVVLPDEIASNHVDDH